MSLFEAIFVPDALARAVSDEAWLQALLDAEAALARASAPHDAAEAIARCCVASRFDLDALGEAGRASGNPVVPLVRSLRDAVGDDAAEWVHRGATSQDILDTAAMLVARRALDVIGGELDLVAEACAELADTHRAALMPARTLLQQAVPTTFGLKAAGWLSGVVAARDGLRAGRGRLAVQLGGAAGTLAGLDVSVVARFAAALDLAEPDVAWHTERSRIAGLGAALALAAGAMDKVALDIVLLAQTEVGEVAERSDSGRGGSSSMPHKRNPVGAVRARGCAAQARGAAGVLLAAMAQEHERAAGAWHSEWEALRTALAMTGGAAAAVREALDGLEVHADRMRANLEPLAELGVDTTDTGAADVLIDRALARWRG